MKVDWDAIGERGFWAAERAAKSVSNAFASVEEDDAYQDALIYLATHVEEIELQAQYGMGQPGSKGGEYGARRSVAAQLTRRLNEWAKARSQRAPLEIMSVAGQAAPLDLTRWGNRPVPPGFEGLAYTPGLIERILPVLWCEALVGGMQAENVSGEDMPKSAADPSHSGTHMAHVVDIRAAWAKAELATTERQALFLSISEGWTSREIGQFLGVSHVTAMAWVDDGIEHIATYLNGKEVPLGVDSE